MATNPRQIGESTRLIAAAIKATRAARGLRQEDLARSTGIPARTIAKIENGQMAIDVEQLGRIADSFGQEMGDFIRYARANANLYRPDGSLNPADTTGYRLSDEEMNELHADDTKNEG
ncbi:helix-turn-helix domain-containing protein [Nocardia sp. NPDC057227]|uniref:helix-turn-helix domain-containing protein n=1 Tax=Nocardia sp. NPDC057227 TaxID=3346056 RepID=UPI00362F75E7